MLSLTKKAEYALIAAAHLARERERIVSAREIAEHHQVPLPLLMNVLKRLSHAGHVKSVRGAHGGYQLAVPPQHLSMASIIAAAEGPVRIVDCVSGSSKGRSCARSRICALRRPVLKVHQRIIQLLAEITVADLAFDSDYGQPGNPQTALALM